MFGIESDEKYDKCIKVVDKVINDLYKLRDDKMELVEKIVYVFRVKKWKELGIMFGGVKLEVFDVIVKLLINLNSDLVDMLVNCLNLGILIGLYGFILINFLNDVMLGELVIRMVFVGFNVIDLDYINIMIIGY